MLLEVSDLSVTYAGRPPVQAVRHVDVALDRGQTLGIAGESGSGKSTLALSLLRLLPGSAQVSGSVRFDGEELTTASWGRLRAVRWNGASVVFQGAMGALNPVRSIAWQIREAIVQHDRKLPRAQVEARIAELLEGVGIPARRSGSYPHELSGGQRQRVMIAMALACRPDLIIADEPTTALDVVVQGQVLALLSQLVAETGVGMIMISHDLAVLAETCARLAVMYAGRIVEAGPARKLIAAPAHPYSEALGSAFPTIGDPASRLAPRGLGGDPPAAGVTLPGCAFAPRCAFAFDRCASVAPELAPAGPDHASACLLVDEPGGIERIRAGRLTAGEPR